MQETETKPIKIKKTTMWKTATSILAILLIISIYTNGFRFNSITGGTTGDTTTDSTVDTITDSEGLSISVLNDKRCEDCDTTNLLAQLKQVFPNTTVNELDYSSGKGKKLYQDNSLSALPAILFTEAVKESEGYSNVERWLEPKGDYLSLRIGSNFDPEAEICDNEIDDTGNGKIDCDDPECASKLVCNKDAFAECAVKYDIEPETVVFYYSNGCGWCAKMKPGVEALEEEGYSFKWVETGNPNETDVINECFKDYLGGGVPQFICPKTAEIRGGAFTNEDRELDLDAMRAWADKCIAG